MEWHILDFDKISIVLFAIEAARASLSEELITLESLFFDVVNFLIGINAEIFIYFDSRSLMISCASEFFDRVLFIIKFAQCTS